MIALAVERTNLNVSMAIDTALNREATKLLVKTDKRMLVLLNKGRKIRGNVIKIVMEWKEKGEKISDSSDFDIQDVTKLIKYASTVLLEDADAIQGIQ